MSERMNGISEVKKGHSRQRLQHEQRHRNKEQHYGDLYSIPLAEVIENEVGGINKKFCTLLRQLEMEYLF